MTCVFVSHAHGDNSLAYGMCALLRDALGLAPEDFFMSSEKGRGVGPGGNIQDEILDALSASPVLIVLLTPKSALSRWVRSPGRSTGRSCPPARKTAVASRLSATLSPRCSRR